MIGESVRFNAEADSLNCSILGPDAAPGTEEFDLFVGEVVRELTQKTGQKCTAIRRSLVPATHAGAVVDALGERLAEVRVGDPRDAATTMGPLVSRDQLAEVQEAVAQLGRGAEVVLGGPGKLQLTSGDPDRGAFLAPTVLRASSPEAPVLHSVEAFGPVTAVLGYRDAGHAVELAALGRGSLVGSVVTHDPGFARQVVGGLAPYHGRLLVLDRDNAGESTGHGAPLPHLVHGGPGRAGGGEELGGIRAVLHLMQVTSVSASPAMVTAVTGRWTPGAPTTGDATHPFRRHFEELRIGEALRTPSRTVTLEDIERFADLSGDRFYAHMDEAAAKANPFFDGRVAHGYFVVSAAAGLFVDPDPGPCLANYGLERLRFLKPVLPRRHPDGVADLQAEDGQGRRGLRRGPLGRRRREPGRREGRHLRRPHPGRHPPSRLTNGPGDDRGPEGDEPPLRERPLAGICCGDTTGEVSPMRVTECAQQAVLHARGEAGRLGHDRIGTEHLLLALLRDQECLATAILGERGVEVEALRRRVEQSAGPGKGDRPADRRRPGGRPRICR